MIKMIFDFVFLIWNRTLHGVKSGDLLMTYNSIYQDVLAATDVVHRKDVSKCIYFIISGEFNAYQM